MITVTRRVRSGLLGLAAFVLWGCAPSSVVVVSSDYQPREIRRVALMAFDDGSGRSGSGAAVADIFAKYLLSAGYQVVERREVDRLLEEQRFSLSGAVNPSQVAVLGRILGVDALALGSLSEFTSTSEHTVMVNMPQQETTPIFGEIIRHQREGDQMIVTRTSGITGYSTTYSDRIVPQTETLPARVGLSVRLVSVVTGAVLWSGTSSADGMDISSAAEYASADLMKTFLKTMKNSSKQNPDHTPERESHP